jgi:mRNA-degrading endonuclease YafQ of YafQ-DinJ toxin-antitoxin module
VSYRLATSSRFDRQLKRFNRKNPELRNRVQQIFHDLQEDPFQPHLRLHPLRGRMDGYHAARIDYSNRIILILLLDVRTIRMVDIGSHDDVYR